MSFWVAPSPVNDAPAPAPVSQCSGMLVGRMRSASWLVRRLGLEELVWIEGAVSGIFRSIDVEDDYNDNIETSLLRSVQTNTSDWKKRLFTEWKDAIAAITIVLPHGLYTLPDTDSYTDTYTETESIGFNNNVQKCSHWACTEK